jgi:signal transduction histidine kinase
VLEVADTGVGIAPEDLKHVFKRFWRGEKSRSRTTGGAGIGLAIVHELVRAHDGRIDVESRPGTGSTFRVSLPALETRALHENGRPASPDLQTRARP